MKKFVVFILSILYITTSSGATLHMHYCMGKLVELGLWKKQDKECGNCGMTNTAKASNDDCCKDEHKEVKGEKDQKLVSASVGHVLLSSEALSPSSIVLPEVYVPSAILENPVSNAPPRSSKVAYYLLNCIFLI